MPNNDLTELRNQYSDRLPMTDAEEQRHRVIASAINFLITFAIFATACGIFAVAGWILGTIADHFTP